MITKTIHVSRNPQYNIAYDLGLGMVYSVHWGWGLGGVGQQSSCQLKHALGSSLTCYTLGSLALAHTHNVMLRSGDLLLHLHTHVMLRSGDLLLHLHKNVMLQPRHLRS